MRENIATMQNICNLIGQEKYSTGHIVLLVPILHSSEKKIDIRGREKI